MNDPLVYVLLAAGAVTVALGEHVDAAVIFGVVAFNTLIGYVQESRAQSALDETVAQLSKGLCQVGHSVHTVHDLIA